jgi:hypothetical protein
MSTYVELVGRIEHTLSSSAEVQPTFDISAWLSTDTIASVSYSAYDELGNDVTATCLDALKHTNTNTVIKPWIKGGGTNNKQITVEMEVTTNSTGETMTFYIVYNVRDVGQR